MVLDPSPPPLPMTDKVSVCDCIRIGESPSDLGASQLERFISGVFTKDTSEEMGQARDTSTHVTFYALKLDRLTSVPPLPLYRSLLLKSPIKEMMFTFSYSGHRKREGKKRIFTCSVRI